ncbi:hypothetical protein GCM10010129_36230 [Streptomyces fumigatiscleroticus]|nr:hypothetical protein GCM10010129_36230 [Streptomyces fumigatiscleroticus]
MAAAAATLAGALALTACGEGDGSDDDATDAASATPTASASADTGGSTGGSASAPADELEGSWVTTADGKAVALMINGEQAGLFATGGTVCSGTAGEQSGTRTIRLKCTDGSDDRASGKVASVSGTTLRITWDGALGEETYTKAEGGQLPTGLPTASLGS